jgi:chromosome segregation ATPase
MKIQTSYLVPFWGLILLSTGAFSIARTSTEDSVSSSESKKSKRVYTNEDLKDLKDTIHLNQASPHEGEPKKATKPGRADSIEGYRDLHGHDETYWKQKIKPLKTQLESLDSQISTLENRARKLNATNGLKVTRDGKLRASSSDTRAHLERQIQDLTSKRVVVLKSIQDLEEEGRRAKALPEWLR